MTENPFGTVVYVDGWHYTVKVDEEDKQRRLQIAQANLDFATRRGDPDAVAAAQRDLADVEAHPHQVPDQRLVLEDSADGTQSRFRLATDADTRSWHERKHRRYAAIVLEDGTQPSVQVSADEMTAIQELLKELDQ